MANAKERLQIAARAGVSTRTVERIYAGDDTKVSTFRRVVAAAKALGIEPPTGPDVPCEAAHG